MLYYKNEQEDSNKNQQKLIQNKRKVLNNKFRGEKPLKLILFEKTSLIFSENIQCVKSLNSFHSRSHRLPELPFAMKRGLNIITEKNSEDGPGLEWNNSYFRQQSMNKTYGQMNKTYEQNIGRPLGTQKSDLKNV